MTIRTVSLALDTSDSSQNTILSNIRNNAAKFDGIQIAQQGASSKWTVAITLDDTDLAQANILTSFYNNIGKFSSINITKIG